MEAYRGMGIWSFIRSFVACTLEQECIRMRNGMERTLEKHLPESDRRWPQSSLREDGEN